MNKVYKSYAFTENEREKSRRNRETFEEIRKKWRVLVRSYSSDADDSNFDLVIFRKPQYHHSLCKVIKNDTDLTQDEIALVCDRGNLCFGYRIQGEYFNISED